MPTDFVLDGGTSPVDLDGTGDAADLIYDGRRPPDWLFGVTLTPVERIVAARSETIPTADRLVRRDFSEAVYTDHAVELQVLHGARPELIAVSTPTDASIAVLEANGALLRHVAAGAASVTAESDSQSETANVTLPAPYAVEETIVGDRPGTLRYAATLAVDGGVDGLVASTAKPLYTTAEPAGPAYVRNPGCWVADVNLTCVSPYNSASGGLSDTTAVSRRHVIMATHALLGVGAQIQFVTPFGEVITRTLTATASLAATGLPGLALYPDVSVGLLDTDLPTSIKPAKVMPSELDDYLPGLGEGIPVTHLDFAGNALVADLLSSNNYVGGLLGIDTAPDDSTRLAFAEAVAGGDSGTPVFMLLGEEPVLLMVMTYTFSPEPAGGGTPIHKFIPEINALLTSLGGGYQLTTADLSAYRSEFE